MRLPPGSVPRAAQWAGGWRWTAFAWVLSLAVLAMVVRVGGDWDWLVAMGDHVRATGEIPDSVPFAAADSSGWFNVPVLAELVASWLSDAGPRSVVLVHLALVATALTVLAATARARGAGDALVAVALGAAVIGGLSTFGVVRAQTYSLLPFALLLALVARQARRPDRGIWWVVPLIAVWGNLHGAALLGTCVLGAYLVMDRLRQRPAETVAVGLASLVALCVTPQGWRTPHYYATVFDNVSAQRAEGLWARPSLGAPFDVLMLGAALALLVVVLRPRRPLWEYVAIAGLVVATASAARHGVWLLFLLVALTAGRGAPAEGPRRNSWAMPLMVASLATVVAVPVAVLRGDEVLGASPDEVAAIAEVAGDRVVLAPAPLSESLAAAGVRLWAGNPLDAFRHEDQAAYLDFLSGRTGMARAVTASDLVVTRSGSAADDVVAGLPGLRSVSCPSGWTCRVRG